MRTAGLGKVHIGSVVRNAVLFDFKRLRGDRLNAESLVQTVDRLFRLLEERRIEYLLVGGVAMLQYVEGRNTEDIDLIMATSSLEHLPEIEIEERHGDFARGRFQGLQIDLLSTRNPLFERARRRYATTRSFVEREIPCATVEGLLLLKMYALPSVYRQGNFARVGLYENDIATLLHEYRPAVEPLLAELAPHLGATELAKLRWMVAQIQQRVEQFDQTVNTSKGSARLKAVRDLAALLLPVGEPDQLKRESTGYANQQGYKPAPTLPVSS